MSQPAFQPSDPQPPRGAPLSPTVLGRLRDLAERLIPLHPSGLTYDLNAGALAPFGPQTWFVSLSGGEQRLPAAPRFDDLVDWVSLHQGLLLQPSHYIGLWPDRRREVHVLDVTVPVDGRERAIRVGNQQGQEVIYHPASGEELALG